MKKKGIFDVRILLRGIIATIAICLSIQASVFAQNLEYLPPVTNAKPNKDTSTVFMLSAVNLSRMSRVPEKKSYVNSIQIIDASQPWPPRWYAPTDLYTDEMYTQDTIEKLIRLNFILGPQIDSGTFTFCEYKFVAKDTGGSDPSHGAPEYYVVLNEKMERVDSIKSRMFNNSSGWKPDFRKNKNIGRLWFSEDYITKDLRAYTNNEADNAVPISAHVLHVINNDDSYKLTWNPFDYLDKNLFNVKEKVNQFHSYNSKDPLKLFKFEFGSWDYDGNILYSLQDIGFGKISAKDGHVIWQINYRDIPCLGKDTIDWTSAINFRLIADNDTVATYSLFGMKGYSSYAKGVVFSQNKKTLKITPLQYVHPKIKFRDGTSRLSFDYNGSNGNYTIGYGYFENSDTADFALRNVFEYGKNDSSYGYYQLPKPVYCYIASRVENYKLPPRPQILIKGENLEVAWKSDIHDFSWYKLDGINNTDVKKVGTGQSIIPEKGSTYCVVARYGIGFSVSPVFTVRKNNPY